MNNVNNLLNRVQNSLVTSTKILFPETDKRIINAIPHLHSSITPVFICTKQTSTHNLHIKLHCECINPTLIEKQQLARQLFNVRKHRGMSIHDAQETLHHPMWLAAMLLRSGYVDGIVAGATWPTAVTLRPVFQLLKQTVVSSCFIMGNDEDVYLFADCAIQPDPSAEDLALIASQTADYAKLFGIEPVIAMLSFSTKGSAEHHTIDKVRAATALVQQARPDIQTEGELQFDAAFIPTIAAQKGIEGMTKSNVFVFPDLNSGNIGYKIAQRLGKLRAVGPLLQGTAFPVNDVSRGCSTQDIIDITHITALHASSDKT